MIIYTNSLEEGSRERVEMEARRAAAPLEEEEEDDAMDVDEEDICTCCLGAVVSACGHACMHCPMAVLSDPPLPCSLHPLYLTHKTKTYTDRVAVQKRKKTAQQKQQQQPQSGSAPSSREMAGAEEGDGEEEDEVDFLSSQPRVAKGMAATLALLRNTGGIGRGVRSSLSYRVIEVKRRRQRLEVD
jgi:hypothetical protein